MDFKRVAFGFLVLFQGVIAIFLFFHFQEMDQKEEPNLFFTESLSEVKEVEVAEVAVPEVNIPFKHYVNGSGKVQPSDRIILSPKQEGVVEEVFVSVGQMVNKGDLLVKLDTSSLQYALKESELELDTNLAKIRCLEKKPSEHRLRAKENEIEQVLLQLSEEEKEYKVFRSLVEQEAVSQRETEEKRLRLEITKREVGKILAEYEDLKGGTSPEEVEIGKAELREKQIHIEAIEKQIHDCTLRSPIKGRILSIGVNQGSFAGCESRGIVSIGSDDPLHLVAYIDAKESWRVLPGKTLRAIAVHKSNPKLHFALKFLHISPELTLDKLCITFSFEKGKAPIYFEQEFDVFIEAASPQDTSCLDYQFHLMES